MVFRVSCKKEGENWWYGAVAEGVRMPVNSATDHYVFDGSVNLSYNQIVTLLVSDQGRYIYVDGGCKVKIGNNEVVLYDPVAPVDVGEGYASMNEAYHAAAEKHFYHSKTTVPPVSVVSPQYCSWVEMLHDIDQKRVEEYAQNVKKAGLPEGIFILDSGWMQGYGDWEFVKEKFPDPKAMCKKLHDLGFKVVLWTLPFVDRSTKSFEEMEKKGLFVRAKNGETAFRTWWNGTSAVLDMTNPNAWEYYKAKLDRLMEEYGVDGFKLDAGDAEYYAFDDVTYAPTTPNGQSTLWAKFAAQYEYSELRACVGMSGYPIVQRLCDKDSSWDKERGLGSLIPDMIQAGLAGYAYCCPDMVGGGQETNFGDGKEHDVELFIRSCQCAALMPMMQFSYAIWEHYDNDFVRNIVRECAWLRRKYEGYIKELLEEARVRFSPMLRNLEYEYPNQGLQKIKDEFLLGKDLLVAPVTEKGLLKRKVVLPKGDSWKYMPTGEIYEGGQTVEVDSPLETLPYFERIK